MNLSGSYFIVGIFYCKSSPKGTSRWLAGRYVYTHTHTHTHAHTHRVPLELPLPHSFPLWAEKGRGSEIISLWPTF